MSEKIQLFVHATWMLFIISFIGIYFDAIYSFPFWMLVFPLIILLPVLFLPSKKLYRAWEDKATDVSKLRKNTDVENR